MLLIFKIINDTLRLFQNQAQVQTLDFIVLDWRQL
jgi:hypothetical protein